MVLNRKNDMISNGVECIQKHHVRLVSSYRVKVEHNIKIHYRDHGFESSLKLRVYHLSVNLKLTQKQIIDLKITLEPLYYEKNSKLCFCGAY